MIDWEFKKFEEEKRRRVMETLCNSVPGIRVYLKSDQVADLHRHVRDWLMRDWDPIGVSGVSDAASEYDSYERQVSYFLRIGTEEILAKHLNDIATEQMGLTRELARDQVAAKKLFASYTEWLRNLK